MNALNNYDLELISAYIDCELTSEESGQMEERFLNEPQLRLTLHNMMDNDRKISEMAHDINREPLSFDIDSLLKNTTPKQSRQKTTHGRTKNSWNLSALLTKLLQPRFGAVLAASLLVYLFIAPPKIDDLSRDANIVSNDLQIVLSSTPSGNYISANDLEIKILLSFHDRLNRLCRLYSSSTREIVTDEVACLDNGHWLSQIRKTRALRIDNDFGFQPAAAEFDNQITQYMNKTMIGIPLSEMSEREILRNIQSTHLAP